MWFNTDNLHFPYRAEMSNRKDMKCKCVVFTFETRHSISFLILRSCQFDVIISCYIMRVRAWQQFTSTVAHIMYKRSIIYPSRPFHGQKSSFARYQRSEILAHVSYRRYRGRLERRERNFGSPTKSDLSLSSWGTEFVLNTLIYMHIYLGLHVPSFFGSISISNQSSLEGLLTKISSRMWCYHNGFLNNNPSWLPISLQLLIRSCTAISNYDVEHIYMRQNRYGYFYLSSHPEINMPFLWALLFAFGRAETDG